VIVTLSRRAAAFLLAVGAFQWVIWPTFLKNIWQDDRSFSHGSPTGFLVIHVVLTGVSLALGTGVGLIGLRGLTAGRSGRA
jgi:hypothetical protein